MPQICLRKICLTVLYLCRTIWSDLGQVSNNYPNSGSNEGTLGSSYFYYQQPQYPRDCSEIRNHCFAGNLSGVHVIKPEGYPEPFEVYRDNDIDSGEWTVIQRRMDGSVSFNRSWKEYKDGFGFLSSEVILGNEKLSLITNQAVYKLRIEMVLSNGTSFYTEYNAFRVTDEWSQYSIISVGENHQNATSVIEFNLSEKGIFRDCQEAYQTGEREDGHVYNIYPSGWTDEPFKVLCNMSIDDGGWTVLQRRVNDSESFDRNWEEYKNGFGILEHEFWLGNDKIYYLTNQTDYELRLDMVNVLGNAYFAKYNLFHISDEDSNYQLTVGDYDAASTTGFDAMNRHRDRFFSTPDRDNDGILKNCGFDTRAGWWFGNDDGNSGDCTSFCFNYPNLGIYDYPWWYYLPENICLIYADIKIRPK